jgi:hypothetical protein
MASCGLSRSGKQDADVRMPVLPALAGAAGGPGSMGRTTNYNRPWPGKGSWMEGRVQSFAKRWIGYPTPQRDYRQNHLKDAAWDGWRPIVRALGTISLIERFLGGRTIRVVGAEAENSASASRTLQGSRCFPMAFCFPLRAVRFFCSATCMVCAVTTASSSPGWRASTFCIAREISHLDPATFATDESGVAQDAHMQ